MSNISASAAAAREAHRTSTGQFGEQAHTPPAAQIQSEPYREPKSIAVDGGSIWLDEWATSDGRAPKWPDGLPLKDEVKIGVDREDESTSVDLYWTGQDGSEHHVWYSRGRGAYADAFSSFETGENDDLANQLDAETRNQLNEYGYAVLCRAEQVADVIEFRSLNGNSKNLALWTRLATPKSFTDEEVRRNAADLRLNDLAERTGCPSVADLVKAGRDRGEITDEQIQRLSYEDVERFGQIWSETVSRIVDEMPEEEVAR